VSAAEVASRAAGERTRPVKLAVLGDPLEYTRSPDLHRAGCAALGLACQSLALRTPVAELPATLDRLAREGYTGCNLTMPLKEPALALVGEATPAARRARSVNTITFGDRRSGDTTDGAGFLDLLSAQRRNATTCNVTLLGAGGSARSLALAIADAGGRPVEVISRREPEPGEAWGGTLGKRWSAWGSGAATRAIAVADVLVNCTPLAGDEWPVAVERIPRATLVVDLTYGERVTPWVAAARAAGLEAIDGLALLVHQARRSLIRWLARDVPLEPLLAAVRP
jgi:shikimate dehydrogenase